MFISDEKRKDPPPPDRTPTPPPELPPNTPDLPTQERRTEAAKCRQEAEQERNQADLFRDALKAGVQVVTVPQLFPTPPDLARQVVKLAEIEIDHRVLEPSAGTGALLKAAHDAVFGSLRLVAVEINCAIADTLRVMFPGLDIHNADFLTCDGDFGQFDRIVMNPPFSNAQDIAHIQHARTFLKPGGRLVAICANGPRQRAALLPDATEWMTSHPAASATPGPRSTRLYAFSRHSHPLIHQTTNTPRRLPASGGSPFTQDTP